MECEVDACEKSKIVVGVEVGRALFFSVALQEANTLCELYVHRLAQREADVLRDHSHSLYELLLRKSRQRGHFISTG